MWREPVYSNEYLGNMPKTSQGTPFGSVLFNHPPPAEFCTPPPQPVLNLEEVFPAPVSPVPSDSSGDFGDCVSAGMANDSLGSDASVDRGHEPEFHGGVYRSTATRRVHSYWNNPAQYVPSSHMNGYEEALFRRPTRMRMIVQPLLRHQYPPPASYPSQPPIQHQPQPPLSRPNAAGQSGRWWIPDDAASTQVQKPGVYAGEREHLPVCGLSNFG